MVSKVPSPPCPMPATVQKSAVPPPPGRWTPPPIFLTSCEKWCKKSAVPPGGGRWTPLGTGPGGGEGNWCCYYQSLFEEGWSVDKPGRWTTGEGYSIMGLSVQNHVQFLVKLRSALLLLIHRLASTSWLSDIKAYA